MIITFGDTPFNIPQSSLFSIENNIRLSKSQMCIQG